MYEKCLRLGKCSSRGEIVWINVGSFEREVGDAWCGDSNPLKILS
jgi:hypothetical protein